MPDLRYTLRARLRESEYVIASVVEYKMFSRHGQELLLAGILGIMALVGLVMLYLELRNVIRAKKRNRNVTRLPDHKDRFRKAG
jgi:hypothetical protein